MAYASDNEEALASELGFKSERNVYRGSSFEKGQRRVWATRMGWQSADLVDGRYRNHKIFEDLSDALRREL